MSDQENFLTRWSRRKLEPADKQTAEQAPPAADAPPAEPAPKAETQEFDISTLPPLDSIGAKSDIRAFLQAGVPSALRHAALRRAWSADPAIRDYIGPNENFWEGVGPGGVAGFGELDPNLDVNKLVAQVLGEAEQKPRETTDLVSPTEQTARKDVSGLAAPTASESAQGKQQDVAYNAEPLLQRDKNIASHQDEPRQEASGSRPRRHGGAMPE